MRTIGATEFKARCLALLDEVDSEGIVITKRGKPVAKLVPVQEDYHALKGKYKGKITVLGDIMSTGERWNADVER